MEKYNQAGLQHQPKKLLSFLVYVTGFYVGFPLNKKGFFKNRMEIQWPSSCSSFYRRGNRGTERQRDLPKGTELSSSISEFPQTRAFSSTLLNHLPGHGDWSQKRDWDACCWSCSLRLPGARNAGRVRLLWLLPLLGTDLRYSQRWCPGLKHQNVYHCVIYNIEKLEMT